MRREEIMQILPHRNSMLLLDDVTEMNGEAVGHYHVRGDEFFLDGHFPGNPIVPGVILCEILAQSACILLKDQMTEGKLPGEKDQIGVFQCPLATTGRLAGIWQEEGGGPLRGLRWRCWVQGRGPLWNVL